MKENRTQLQKIKALCSAIEFLEPFGWTWEPRHPKDWIFSKDGKLFDLSAADISKHEEIFEKGAFLINLPL